MKMSLLISLGACESLSMLSQIDEFINDHSPCLIAMGSKRNTYGRNLEKQYKLFYKKLICTNSILEAHKALIKKFPNKEERLFFFTCSGII